MVLRVFLILYGVSGKKGDKNIFCNIFCKSRAILMKFGTWFPE